MSERPQPRPETDENENGNETEDEDLDLVEEASMDSFPASDPPAVWNRPEPEDDQSEED